MLARSRKIKHPLGIEVETPLLVPSFSSKGFSFNKNQESEAIDAFKLSKEFLTESLLISAYDVHHMHIPFTESDICTDITIIDSGGYETSDIYDLSATAKYSYPTKHWTIENYEEVITKFPEYKAGILVSYDHGSERKSLEDQINQAKTLFKKYPNFLYNFLIKPETDEQRYIQLDNIFKQIYLLDEFSIIGVTEKELGNSILARMINIAKIRKALDEVNNPAPIHIFGSLDPITSILYFLCGAEVFDGLTWLKFAYFNGSAIYQANFGALHNELGIHVRDSQIRSKSIVNNIYCLEKMKYLMIDFSTSGDFNLFNDFEKGLSEILKRSFKTFESSLK